MMYKHAFINASPLAYAEPGESQRSLVAPGSNGPASTDQMGGLHPGREA